MTIPKPTKELLALCLILNMRHEKGLTFTYKGHEIDLTGCDFRIISILHATASQLADRLTKIHNGHIESMFGI